MRVGRWMERLKEPLFCKKIFVSKFMRDILEERGS
jgi:hypothetical protein